MKKTFLLMIAMLLAISGWTQTTLNEGFEGTTFPPEDWSTLTSSTSTRWSRNTSSPVIGTASAKYAYISGGQRTYLITPKLVVATNDTLKFYAAKSSSGATDFRVCISNSYVNGDISSFDTINPLFHVLATNLPTTFATQYMIDLSAYAGQEVYIAFQTTDYNGCNVFLDNITGPNLFVPSCPKTSVLTLGNITTTSADVSWTENGTANEWAIEYKPTNETNWNNAISVTATSTIANLSNLIENTAYDIRVKAICLADVDESEYRLSSFRTTYPIISQFPWFESFEDSWSDIAIAPGNQTAPFGWINIDSLNTSSYYWKTTTTAKYGSKSAYMYGYSSATTTTATYNNNDWFISPILTLTGGERLNFWAKKSSTSYYPDLLVYAMDVSQSDLDATGSNANFTLIGSIDTLLLNTTFTEFEYNLSSLIGDYRLAFVRKKIANGSVYIDGVKVSTIPTCFPPTGLVASNISSDQADIAWTAASENDANWNLYLTNTTNNSTEVIPVSGNIYTLTNLTPNTIYYGVLLTDCGNDTQSDSSSSIIIRTNCVPSTVPFTENFSTSVVTEPTCWTRFSGLLDETSVLTSTTSGWSYATVLDTTMRVNIYGASCKYWLATPTLDLGADGSLYQVDFDAVYADLPAGTGTPTNSDDDKFAVVISTDNGVTWSSANATIWYASADSTYSLTSFGSTSTHISVKLQDHDLNPYQGLIKIALYAESQVAVTGADNYLLIDNFNVDLAPVCPEVFNTTANSATFTSIQVNFATDNAEVGTGWEIAYAETTDPASFDPNTVTPIYINSANELPYNITGLNSESTYYVSVRQNCGGNWSPAVSVTLPAIVTTSTLPYTQNFNDLTNISEWTLTTADTNKWFIGSAANYPETTGNSMYITNDNGLNNTYAIAAGANYEYASTNIEFGAGLAEYNLSFDWRAYGESATYDYIRVYLLPIDEVIPTTGWPTSIPICENLNLHADWQHKNIVLPTSLYQNTIKKLVFVWWNDATGGTNPPAAIDNISIQAMTCATPSNLVVNSSDQTTVDLSWTENGTASQWLVEYTSDNINWDTAYATTNQNFILSGLNPSATYQVKVTAICDANDISGIIAGSFITSCGIVSQFPWTEGFEDAFVGTTASNALNASPRCWLNYNGGYTSTTYQWKRGTTAANIYSGSGYAYMDGYASTTSTSYTNNDWLITPILELTGNERLNFWVKKEGATYSPDLAIYALNVANGDVVAADSIANFTLLYNIPTSEITTNYQQQEINLSSLVGQYRLAFVRLQPSQYDIYIDEVQVSELPTCIRPIGLALNNVSHQDATISWTPGHTTDANWNIYLTEGTNTTIIPTTQIPTTIPSLLPNTTYSVVVKTDCGTEESDPSIPFSFTTTCTPLTVPYLEQFATTPLTNNCWSQHNGLLTDTVAFTSNTSSWTFDAMYPAGNIINSMRLNIWSTSTKSWLISPTIDLGNSGNLYQLEFDVTNTDDIQMLIPGVTTGVDDKFAVVISTDNGLTWRHSNARIWSNETGATRIYNDLMSASPIHIIIPLEDSLQSAYQGLIKVGFYGESTVSNADNYLRIDNLAINEWVNCQRPTGLAINEITSDQATISFVEQGQATSWDYVLGVVGQSANDPDTETPISIIENPHTITGLNPSTNYFIAVRSNCGSPWSDILTFRTSPLLVNSFPYSTSFDTTDAETYNWASTSNSINKWNVGGATYSDLTPSLDGSSAYMSFNNGDSNSVTTATTYSYFYRDIDFGTDPTTYDLTFDWKCLGAVNTSNAVTSGIMVIVCDLTDSINLAGLPINQNQRLLLLHGQTNWQNAEAQIDGVSGVKRLIFYTWGGYATANRYNPAAIDNINIDIATCYRPNNIVVNNLSSTSADLSWVGTADSYVIAYRSETETNNTYASVVGNTTYSLTNLTSGTDYYVSIRSICGTDTTIYSSTMTFRTPCYDNAISNFPYNEGFENGLNCWQIAASGTATNSFWQIQQTGTSPTCTPHGGLNMARFNSYSSPNTAGTWTTMISPSLDFSSDMEASFWIYRDAATGANYISPLERVSLYVSSSQSLSDTILLGEISRTITASPVVTVAGWYQYTFPIPTGTIGTQYIVLKATSTYGNNIFIDDVKVDFLGGIIPCAAPTAINVNNITNTTADVAWTAGGSETAWQVRLGTTGTPIDVNTPSYQLTNLTAATNYTVYVRANCGTSYSAWVASTQFTTTNVVVIPPTVVTDSVSAIAQNQANLYGTITTGTETISAQGFAYKLTSASTWISVAATGTNMTYNLTGLTANSSYDFRAFATTATNTYYGNIINFTTTNVTVTPPTVVTDSVSAITHNQANLYGTITTGTEAITAQGFDWKLSGASSWTNVTATGTNMTYTLTGLTANTAYEFRAYATTASNTYYGDVKTFNTLATPVVLGGVSTQAVTNLVDHSALLHGTLISVGNAVENIEVGFIYSTETNPEIGGTDVIIAQVNYVDGMTTYDKSITGLLSETNYYYKAYVTNSAGTAYGQEQPFLTSSLNDAEKNQFTVSMYPNPTTSTTKLVVNGIEGEAKIVISDVQGRILNTTIAKAIDGKVEQTIDVNNFAKGIYYVRIQNTTTSRTQKLIVQ
ncbi:MAG: fibronectin type III domain-containing protein [Bacteroidales bacterium]|jgi:hypothetical protein